MKINEIVENNVQDLILKNCSQFLKESKGQLLWRGGGTPQSIDTNQNKWDLKTLNNTRNPSASSDECFREYGKDCVDMFTKVDNQMMQAYGIGRSDTFQFTGEKSFASEYGDTYLCFPLDGYDYLWSPRIYDYAQTLPSYTRSIKQFISSYKSTDLAKAIKSNNEILIRGPFYAVIPKNLQEFYNVVYNKKMAKIYKGWLRIVHDDETIMDYEGWTIKGSVSVLNDNETRLPENLTITGDLSISSNIRIIPKTLKVGGRVTLQDGWGGQPHPLYRTQNERRKVLATWKRKKEQRSGWDQPLFKKSDFKFQ